MYLAKWYSSIMNKSLPNNKIKTQDWTKKFIKKYRPALKELAKK